MKDNHTTQKILCTIVGGILMLFVSSMWEGSQSVGNLKAEVLKECVTNKEFQYIKEDVAEIKDEIKGLREDLQKLFHGG